jgi:hypothetical protein
VSTSQLAFVEKRRSARIDRTIVVTVRGMDAFRAHYVEKVPTVTLSCHGCRYRSKHEVLVGNLVLLELGGLNHDLLDAAQARVRWVNETTVGNERVWDVAVELETPGNFWGVASPPENWFTAPEYKATGRPKSGQELHLVPRPEQKIESFSNPGSVQLPASLEPFVAGLTEHVQRLVSEGATAVIVKEQGSLVDKFRAQLEQEMVKTLERVLESGKEELIRKGLNELTEALEASARNTQEHWTNQIEQGLNSATELMATQAAQVSERIVGIADIAVGQLHRKVDHLRQEMLDQIKIGSLNICQKAEDFLQQSGQRFADQMQERVVELRKQFESNISERLARVNCELDQKSSTLLEGSRVALVKLSESYQETMRGELQALSASALEQATNTLNEQAAEISKQSLSQLQSCTRRYLESICGSIAEVSKQIA